MKTNTMDWKLILLLSIIGLIMGMLSVNGFTQKTEPVLWLLFGIAASLLVSRNVTQSVFLHGLFIGLSWGILNSVTQSLFFDTYVQNNPGFEKNFQNPSPIQPRYFFLITGPIIGLLTGVVLGGLALLFRKVF